MISLESLNMRKSHNKRVTKTDFQRFLNDNASKLKRQYNFKGEQFGQFLRSKYLEEFNIYYQSYIKQEVVNW